MQQDHFDLRKEEIITACESLYDEYSFKEITIKLISEKTTFSRPSIYNYFETKEEIFLALFQKEYDKWNEDLQKLSLHNKKMTNDEFACELAKTVAKRERLLKLLSMNMYDLEENSRLERLIEFKKSYGSAFNNVRICLKKFFPKKTDKEVEEFIFSFFPFMFGIYPYAVVTSKQKEAMKEAGINYNYHSLYELAYLGIKKLLG